MTEPSPKTAKKTMTFEGYIGGDYECFCLLKVPFSQFIKHASKIPEGKKAFWKWYNEHEALSLYPDDFFPEACSEGKWVFKIVVEAKRIEEGAT